MRFIRNNPERVRFFKFAVVGSIGFIIDFSIFNLFRNVFFLSVIVSNSVSFFTALTSNFIFHRFWTFPESRSKKVSNQVGQFLLVSIAGYIIRTGILISIIPPYKKMVSVINFIPDIYKDKIAENIALATVVIIVMFWNYFVNRKWTYNDIENN